ncbi:arylsulfatase B-like [Hylaeus volcanicus]|uniref:arylsulfatase B-like n=1 Tax=Hylaeus volcanicus TaxID=313075 RepID=UPI0023B811F9|nr:arylsulfatase B-like [Hylaeus volcanicus]
MCRFSSIWINTSVLHLMLCVGYAVGLYETAPHIIVFMADDLGWNDVGFHGSNQIPTPNIDALGYNGIILNRHYVLPSSTPSRTAFYTGQYPIRIGMQGDGIRGGEPRGLPLNIKILPEYLRGLGYTTKLIGKWHMGYHTPQHTPMHRGFDYFLGFYNSHISYYDYKYSIQNMSGYDMHRGDDPAYGTNREYATDLFTLEAIKIIENHELPRPLYLQISHLAVHAPLEYRTDRYNHRGFAEIREPNRRKYAEMVMGLDDSLGRIFHVLGERAMLRDSLILFLTDNGAATIGKFRNWGSNYPLRGVRSRHKVGKSRREFEIILISPKSWHAKSRYRSRMLQVISIYNRISKSRRDRDLSSITTTTYCIKTLTCLLIEKYQIARDLDSYLEHYGRILVRQTKLPIDWYADPRRRNNTWEPWMNSGAMPKIPNTAAVFGHLVYCIHVTIIFIYMFLNTLL